MTTFFSHQASRGHAQLEEDLLAFADRFDANEGLAQKCADRIQQGLDRCIERKAYPTLFMLAGFGYRAVLLAGMQRLIDAENEAAPTDDEPTLAKIQAAVSSAITDMKLDQDEFESEIRRELDGIRAKVNRMEANACSA